MTYTLAPLAAEIRAGREIQPDTTMATAAAAADRLAAVVSELAAYLNAGMTLSALGTAPLLDEPLADLRACLRVLQMGQRVPR